MKKKNDRAKKPLARLKILPEALLILKLGIYIDINKFTACGKRPLRVCGGDLRHISHHTVKESSAITNICDT